MAPRRPMLQQYSGGTVCLRRPQQQARRAESTPEVGSGVRNHPPVAITSHALNNKRQNSGSCSLADLTPRVTQMLLEFAYTVG